MTFSNLFDIYYGLLRGEPSAPAITDPEWTLAVHYYNNALNRMKVYDDTKWNFLWTTLQLTGTGGVKTISTGTTTYAAPTNMQEPGGQLTLINTNSGRTNYPIVQPHEAQGLGSLQTYGYFTGDEEIGFTLHFNPSPTSTINGYGIDYNYYRKPTPLVATTEPGTSVIEGGDPAFYYNHMLAQRFRAFENYPSYQTALRDAEEALKGMKLKNNSGTYYNPWNVTDLGSGFGDVNPSGNWGF